MPISEVTTDEFQRQIAKQFDRGYSFAPFVGSGLSSPSGILTGQDFTEYLTWAVYRSVGPKDQGSQPQKDEWSPQRDGWLPFPKRDEVTKARIWVAEQFKSLCERYGFEVRIERTSGYLQYLVLGKGKRRWVYRGFAAALSRPLVPLILYPVFPPSATASTGQDRPTRSLDLDEVRRFDKDVRQIFRALGKTEHVQTQFGHRHHSPSSQDYLSEQAIRSLYDWRATLEFLSRLVPGAGADGLGGNGLSDPQVSVVDSFNTHITSGRKPNLGHKMLAHLAGPLRVRLVLTTNFDTLLEEAYTDVGRQTHVLEVTTKGNLPDAATVRARDSIVKLHGGSLNTRADFSLDDPPPEEDKQRFAEYLTQTESKGVPSHLLVVGYSGSDNRCVQLIKHVLDVNLQFKVYWIAHTKKDLAHVQDVFHENEYTDRIILTQSSHPDFFLYDLYQRIRRTLPAGGFSFQYSHNCPPESSPPRIDSADERKDASLDTDARLVVNSLLEHSASAGTNNPINSQPGFRIKKESDSVLVVDHFSGITTILRRAIAILEDERRMRCLWFELEDYADPWTCVYEVMRSIAIREGLYHTSHLVFGSKPDGPDRERRFQDHIKGLMSHLHVHSEDFVLVFYGRNTPGSCSGFLDRGWTTEHNQLFMNLLQALGKQCGDFSGFRIIYAPFSIARHSRQKDREEWIKRNELGLNPGPNQDQYEVVPNQQNELKKHLRHVEDLEQYSSRHSECSLFELGSAHIIGPSTWKDKMENALKWANIRLGCQRHELTNDQLERASFLYGLTLFRQSRHHTALYCHGVARCPQPYEALASHAPSDVCRVDRVAKYMAELRELGLFFAKPGGYAWMYSDTRLGLRRMFQAVRSITVTDGHSSERRQLNSFLNLRARAHFWIGDWYLQAFCATGHFMPFVESLYHRFQCACFSPVADRLRPCTESPANGPNDAGSDSYKKELLSVALAEMVKTIRLARPWVKYWMNSPVPNALFQLGKDGDRPEGSAGFALELVEEGVRALWPGSDANPDGFHTWCKEQLKRLRVEFESIDGSLQGEAGLRPGKVYRGLPVPRAEPNEPPGKNLPKLTFGSDVAADKCFDGARQSFKRWLEHLDFNEFVKVFEEVEQPKNNPKLIYHNGVRVKCEWLQKKLGNGDYRTADLVHVLSEFAYLHVKRAKLESHAWRSVRWSCSGMGENPVDPHGDANERSIRLRWTQVWTLCELALDLCRYLHPALEVVETEQRVKILTIYGLAMGYCGRFVEAHRRLSEAQALLSKARRGFWDLELAIIRLRRAEVHLEHAKCEAIQRACAAGDATADGDDKKRLRCARVDDAWSLLENAEQALSGRSQSSLWWGRLIALKLRCFGSADGPESSVDGRSRTFLSLAYRTRVAYDKVVENLFDRGWLTSPQDPYRRLRLIDYSAGAALSANRSADRRALLDSHRRRLEEVKRTHSLDAENRRTLLDEYFAKLDSAFRNAIDGRN
jgi:hypothetical protein